MKSVLSGISAVKYNNYKQETPGWDHLLSSSLHPAYPSSPCSGPGRQTEPGHVILSGKYKQDVLLWLNSNQHLNTPHMLQPLDRIDYWELAGITIDISCLVVHVHRAGSERASSGLSAISIRCEPFWVSAEWVSTWYHRIRHHHHN